jgi:adenylate kinase family enzyme
LLPYYAAQGKLRSVDGMADMSAVTASLVEILAPAA